MNKKYISYYSSPVGLLKIVANSDQIIELSFVDHQDRKASAENVVIKKCKQQLDEYFKGKRKNFDLPLLLNGTEFQKTVWHWLKKIPYGKTLSYGDIARRMAHPKAFRAVGMANNKNKIAIILPCHRVVGSDGSMTGYASGIWRKEWLLEHEQDAKFHI